MILLKLTGGWSGDPYWLDKDSITGLGSSAVHIQEADKPETRESVPGTRIDLIGGCVGSTEDLDANHVFVRELPEVVLSMLEDGIQRAEEYPGRLHIVEPNDTAGDSDEAPA